MSANGKLLEKFAAKEIRQIDLGDFADSDEGKTLDVWVNAPGVLDWTQRRKDATSYDPERHVVALLYDMAFVEAKALPDPLLMWLYTKGLDLYMEYHQSLKKKSSADSAPISIPFMATP